MERAPNGATSGARTSATGSTRVDALDGLRAVAVLIIMGYHFGIGWLGGGFFSLDIFYVLSGYLITGLLLGEFRRRRAIALGAFWLRRARRLLPALLVVLVAVLFLVRFVAAPGAYPDYRMSALSALFYFSNWWQIATSNNYFAVTGAVSPLTHTWSLAVEEQFYLVWPLVVLAVMTLGRTFRRGVTVLLVLSVAGALASALEMALLYSPTANTTRLYFGTDTHAQSILVGSVLACVMTLVELRRGHEGMAPAARSRLGRTVVVGLGLCGLAGTATLTATLGGLSPIDYRGGFLVSALSAAAVIVAAVCAPGAVVARALTLRPLIWIGTVSYGAYLWHFPVYVFVNPDQVGLGGIGLLVLRVAVTFALAAASYYLIERPVMVGSFWRSLRAIPPAAALVGGTVVIILAGTVVPAVAGPPVGRYRSTRPGPPEVVVLGDSLGLTLGYALAATAPNGTKVVNGGLYGCGLTIGTSVSNNPPTPELAMFPSCNTRAPVAQQWPALDARVVAHTDRRDTVLFVAGEWEVQDIFQGGRWRTIEQPSYRRYLLGQMRRAVTVATAHGAHLDFTTLPPLAAGAYFQEGPLPEDSPARRALYDHLIEQTAAEFPGRVGVIDYGRILSPDGVFTRYLDGVQVRTVDGVHTPSYAPGNIYAGNSTRAVAHAYYDWLAPRIWPLIEESNPGSARDGPPGQPTGG